MFQTIKSWYAPQTKPVERDYFIDNCKTALIILVILGHFFTQMRWLDKIQYLYQFIYLFHMPCFCFVSGYLAKSVVRDNKLRIDKVISTLWLYFLFILTYYLLQELFHIEASFSFGLPDGAKWYLLSLASWYLLVPFIKEMKPWVLLPLSIIFSLLIGLEETAGRYFSISRTITFLPFFAFGYYLKKEQLTAYLNRKLHIPAAVFLGAVLAICMIFGEQLKPFIGIVYGDRCYAKAIPELASYGILIRLGWYLAASLLSAAFLLVIPRVRFFFSYLGERTLQIYILHILVRNVMAYLGFFTAWKAMPKYTTLLVFPLVIALAFLLGNRWIKRVFDFIANPIRHFRPRRLSR